MNPSYHFIDPPSSPFVAEELNLDLQPLSSSSSSSSSRTVLLSDRDRDGPSPQDQSRFTQPQPDDMIQMHQELRNDCQLVSADSRERDITRLDPFQSKEDMSEDGEDHEDYYSSHKWLPSKLRIIRKMMSSNKADGNRVATNSADKFEDQKQSPSPRPVESNAISKGVSYRNNDNTTRVCSDCNTTKTPLWRSGPRGPKSLCNACGIRQRKARRALAAAAAAANGTILPSATPSIKINVKSKIKKPQNDCNTGRQLKKGWNQQNNLPPNSSSPTEKINNLWYKDFTSRILSKHYSTYQRAFPQDEREAAILLMALSYGLVHG